jgi:GNAT superfamily N-acetyltransferase
VSRYSPVVSIEALTTDASTQAIEDARALLLEYGRFVTEAEGSAHFCYGKLQDEMDGLPDFYRKHGGELLLVYVEGAVAGCVTWRAIPGIGGACEMKRLWVRPAFRGARLSESLVLTAIERAASTGFDAMYLDTFPGTMKSAYEMYLRLGFTICPPFNNSSFEGIIFMRRPLP